MDVSLDGKVALVTGAGPNIGSGIALMLARYGAKVACNDVRREAAEATQRRIERNGGTAMTVLGDVTSEADVKRYIQEVLDAYGRIDILVNNAGLLGGRPLLLETLQDFNRHVEVTAAGQFLNSKYAAISMIERGIKGCIWSVISSTGLQGLPGVIAYSFHKSGLFNFVRAAAIELAPYGIRVNSITPAAPAPDNPELIATRRATQATRRPGFGLGRVDPNGLPEWWRNWGSTNMRDNVPMGESPTPTDIGHLVAWISSDYARLITGQDFTVDGGARAKSWGYSPEGSDFAGPLPLIPMDVTEGAP
ncbi:MAG: SDR family oxidoreductase [Chloroflexi bacterium]|nr:SDR family oxidoreductase [Chloroflexota bacterium]